MYNKLGSPIKFKHIIALTNETYIMFSITMKIKYNVTICLNLIGEPPKAL